MNQTATNARRAGTSFRSVIEMWNHRVQSTPDATAWLHREASGIWCPTTWREADQRVRAIAAGLRSWGLDLEDRVAIHATTSVDWILTDLAIQVAGGATTTIFPQETSDRIAHILLDAQARWVVCDTDDEVRQVLSVRDRLPALEGVVVLHGTPRPDAQVVSMDALEDQGRSWLSEHPDGLQKIAEQVGPDHLAALLYTSGTMGEPRGVELLHDAWVFEAEAIDQLGVVGPTDVQLLFLPLAHVFARVMHVAGIRLGVPTAVDGRVDRLAEHLEEVRPTWLAGVPRVYERIMDRVHDEAADRGIAARYALQQALTLGSEIRRRQREGERVGVRLRLAHAAADRLILAPIRARFGGRLRFLVSGGAPLPLEVARFFDAAGITICEGYGLTESSAATCVNVPGDVVLGTVGRPVPGAEVRIADDGEVLLRSRGVMRAYHNLPQATDAALDEEGWLHTGDIGRLLPSGHLRITDRKKAILVLANGKKVAPAMVEQAVAASSPLIAHATLHGEGRPWCCALLSLDPAATRAWADREGVDLPADPSEWPDSDPLQQAIDQAISDVNRTLAGYEQIRRFRVLPAPFTIDNGLLTPSLKVRRRAVEAAYQGVLDHIYGSTRPA